MNKKKVNRMINEILHWAIVVWISVGLTGVLLGSMYVVLRVILDFIYS